MLRAITMVALAQAVRDGAYRATFRTFSVEALRHIDLGEDASPMRVSLWVRHGSALVEYGSIAVGCDPLAYLPLGGARNGIWRRATIDGMNGHLR